ncbi:aminotransferase class III-fold pyridoxal phosphate-dependent enzyme [Stigmatella sp. ncwal1]|uniref:Aminotransferase class III-fold pyridoxal phosphate-dependent enzyme n=1 Tax=Stigmatella ashevillensis TaxID=2995309 RepID=A0ABT5D4E2_9BACT|nr:aminotransferase class III-fold pyridoxal phosphate-dependent enzyme [Stigmatella ashevillena]MDC0707919.1 aminotransferase class III-fold pyridoxal phosphate-dependent enzyme [Stigmatella ashevillena]
MHRFTNHMNPHLGGLLETLRMDKRFIRGERCYLYDEEGKRYLDFVSSYGALPFGFNPPEIWQALHDVEARQEPSLVQPSALEAAGELAEKLLEVVPKGLRYVTFANSGAEAVEAAIKMCRAATGRPGILATDNSFHGKTLGALSATGNDSYQQCFGAPVAGFERIPYGDLQALQQILEARGKQFAAFILEPIQGEGGIIVPPPGYLAKARELCHQHGVLFVLDEIQTGLGRTGTLFACEAEGVSPDVMTLAKALGGGLVPIGAVLCNESAYTKDFALKHSSTFAGNTLVCRVGLQVLELLTRENQALVRQVAENGAFLKAGLEALRNRYPNVLRDVRGRGYLLGMDLQVGPGTYGHSSFLEVLSAQKNLSPILSSYLLNVERLRVAPTLNGSSTLRIEPPLIATQEMAAQALASIDRMLGALAVGNTAELLRHLLGTPARPHFVSVSSRRQRPKPTGAPEEGRFAFLVHPVTQRNYAEFDKSLSVFQPEELSRLGGCFNDMITPFVAGSTRVEAHSGKTAYGEFIAVPRTAEEFLRMPTRQAVAEIRAGVELARERGARIVGLGAFTSVVTRGGLLLRDTGVALTTGNSYTVVAAVDAVSQAMRGLGTKPAEATAAVVGATGSIGRATAILLAENVGRLLLIGNPAQPERSLHRLRQVAVDLCRSIVQQLHQGTRFEHATLADALQHVGPLPPADAEPERFMDLVEGLRQQNRLVLTTDLPLLLSQADLVLTATSSVEALVSPQFLKSHAVVCDLSRPPNVSRLVRKARPDVLVIDGGVMAVPGLPDLGWQFGFDQGLAYACMAETMILGLEHHYQNTSLGSDLNLPTILRLRQTGATHGFRLAQLRSFDRPLSDVEWNRHVQLRRSA